MGENKCGSAAISYNFPSPSQKGVFFMSKFKANQSVSAKLKKLCVAALFCALAYASTFIFHFKVMFLTFDVKDAIVTLAGLLFGPLYSIFISLLVSILEFISMGETGPWGLLMDILSTATFSTICALIYKYKKNIKGAIIGLVSSVFAMTAVMLLFNIFITPIYMGVARTEVIALLPSLFLPFNLIKGIMNAAISMILYKPISKALKAARILPADIKLQAENTPSSDQKKKNLIFSLIVTLVGVAVIALCILIFIFFMGGEFSFI